ncbi:hypothetical protein VTI74DRAFT_5265 [Chaetomium olivicolor]
MTKKCETLMEKLYGNATDSDVGLGLLGAYGDMAVVSADRKEAEKPLYEDDAGLGLRS